MHLRPTRSCLGLIATAGLALTLSGCVGSGGERTTGSLDEMEEVTLSFHLAAPAAHPTGVAVQGFVDEIAEKTNGKVTIEPYFSNSLLPDTEDLSGVGTGVADMGVVFATRHPEELPVVNWFTGMQSLRSNATPHGFLQGSAALQHTFTTSEAIQEEAEGHNLVLLGAHNSATNVGMICNKPITSAADAQGVRARVGGPVWSAEAVSMGFAPVTLPSGGVYEALQRGVIDCNMADPTTVAALGLWEVAKYYHPVAASAAASTLVAVNKDTWDSLPAEVHEIMETAMVNYVGRALTSGLDGYKAFAEGAEDQGVTIVDARPLNEVLHKHQQNHVEKELIESAPSAVTDPEAFTAEWRSTLEKAMDLAVENVGTEPAESQSPEEILEGYKTGADKVDLPGFLSALGTLK